MTAGGSDGSLSLPHTVRLELEGICDRFEAAWMSGQEPLIEDYFAGAAGHVKGALLPELIRLDIDYRRRRGQTPCAEQYFRLKPDSQDAIREICEQDARDQHRSSSPKYDTEPTRTPEQWQRVREAVDQALERPVDERRPYIESACGNDGLLHNEALRLLRNHERVAEIGSMERSESEAERPGGADVGTADFSGGAALSTPGMARPVGGPIPERVGRYSVAKRLGQGGFGQVFLANDDELKRSVVIKVPHAHRISTPEDIEAYLAEARIVASLDHPSIVPVFDVGRTDDGLCYVVSKFIEGRDLAATIAARRPSPRESAELVAQVADALHYAHGRRIVHRDIKPANLLIGTDGRPYVLDFGIALGDDDFGKVRGVAGTPVYMSPEQAREEAHLVDGRSDIFSLGVVFYELLTGSRPFTGGDWLEIIEWIKRVDARPPRQLDDTIPKELERICLKALAKRATDRYTTAYDMADDLRNFLDARDRDEAKAAAIDKSEDATAERPVRIVPKGLRSFDASDADFFLDLLPGPCDRDGLPESIRFWKTRIEETDPDETFRVGLIYGPSGCGKSSLVKAGLLPRLADHVVPVYVEATAEETASRLLRALVKRCPGLPADLDPSEAIAELRRGHGLSGGKKVVLVIDQFEQWLHARWDEDDTDLVQALRQCDGGNVQCIVMVRDDFWMAVTRFMRAVEVRLVEGQNSAAVDLFPVRHAQRVLTAFGRAFGVLPDQADKTAQDEKDFLKQSVHGLAEEGKVVCVRLALFAEMMKGKSWTPATLMELGGTAGVGVTFLEETFSVTTAPPEHRYHQKAARAILKALLPESGTDIKGSMRSNGELLEASGYAERSRDFGQLIDILDREIRLITPTDPAPAGQEADADSELQTDPAKKYYQLTHDYLVPSLRTWLNKKQRETRQGRAELRLAERATLWNAKPEDQRLPAWWECLNILALTRKRDWTNAQRRMMSAAARYYAMRTAALAVLIALMAWGGREMYARFKSTELVNSLVKAKADKVLETVDVLEPYIPWAMEPLQQLATLEPKTLDEARQQLHARLALVGTDENQVPALFESLLTESPDYVGVIRDALGPYKEKIVDDLWREFHVNSGPVDRRFRAGTVLAEYAPGSEKWTEDDYQFLAKQLLLENPKDQPVWLGYLRPLSGQCIPYWERLFSDMESSETQLLGAANALAEFARDDQERIVRLLTIANTKQYPILFPLVASSPDEAAKSCLAKTAAELPADDLSSVDRVPFGQRRAGAGITLLRLGERESVWPTFDMTDDPEALTQFIHRCRDRGVRAEELLECLRLAASSNLTPQTSSRTRYALLLTLGEYPLSDIPEAGRDPLVKQLADWHEHDPSSAVHGATGWLLRQWGQDEVFRTVDQTPAPYSADREWFTLAITAKSPRRARTSETLEDGSKAPAKEKATSSPDGEPAASSDEKSEQAPTDNADTSDDASANNEPREQHSAANETEKAEGSNASSGDAAQSEKEPQFVPSTFYFTFIVFPAGEYHIGSMSDEPDRNPTETRHAATITRPFAVLDRELTFAELIAFDRQYAGVMQPFEREPVDAAFGPNWYGAVDFCRWLTEQAGLSEEDQPYLVPAAIDAKQFPRDPNREANWAPRDWPVRLDRQGFRLPTEVEWEVACRAGTRTMYGHGGDVGLLRHYAWSVENSGKRVHPPKTRRPGLRGLFDMHGNLFEWCHDWHSAYRAEAIVDGTGPADMGSGRVNRGGGWRYDAAYCRSSSRGGNVPSGRNDYTGFRLTLVPSNKDVERQETSENAGAEVP